MKRIVSIVAVTLCLVALVPAPAAEAHWSWCGSKVMRWSTSNTTYAFPASWDSRYQTATKNGANSITATDFDYRFASPNAAVVMWFAKSYGATGWSGMASRLYDSDTCLMSAVNLYYNTYYTNGYSASKLQAVGVHELGHGIGLGHVSDGCKLRSMMQESDQCRWNVLGINTVQSHDAADVNGVY